LKAINLLCEYSLNPIGLDEKIPRFCWEVDIDNQEKFQSAYQILVASSREKIQNNNGDQWDSGKIKSKQSVNNIYEGMLLESGEKYFWKVIIWDENGEEGLSSNISTFEMGLLNPKDWEGYWIEQNEDEIKGPLFRKDFTIEKDIKKARVYVTGLGYYELHINGQKIGDKVLDPGWTDYDKRILYSAYDITTNLNKGKNTIGIMLGNGRYTPDEEFAKKTASVNSTHSLKVFGGKPVALLQINIEFCDGSKVSIYTDDKWKVASGPIIFNDIYQGETYDARLEKVDWDTANYDDSDWKNAVKVNQQPKGKLISQATFPTIKVSKTLYPKKIISPKSGVYVYDFEQNFAGWIRFNGIGKNGDKVKIRYSELINDDGTINTTPNRCADATDVYIFKGAEEEIYEPRFTYHGFRYVEITGFPGAPSLKNIEGKVVHTSVPETGRFFCSNDLINKIHNIIHWTQVSNLMSVPTDCPQRDERMGWMGDAQLVAEESMYNFNMVGFYKKWLADIRDAQREDGSLPGAVPPYWKRYPADPAWGTACMVIPWYVYLFFNDKRILEENYLMMKKWVGFLQSYSKDNIVLELGNFGDWVSPRHMFSVDTPLDLISTWYYYHDNLILGRVAKILGKEKEAKKFNEKAVKIKEAFNNRFFKENGYSGMQQDWQIKLMPIDTPEEKKEKIKQQLTKYFPFTSQTSNVLPLYLDMVPDNKKEQILDVLIQNIKVVYGNHLNTGIIGTRYIMDVLTNSGYSDLAYKLVTQTTYPSWGYMLKEGATTIWERWEYLADAGMNSHNQIMLGSVDTWFYKALAGINIDLSTPGFEEIVIKPIPVNGLDSACASLETIRGVISSKWQKVVGSINLEVIIPGNSKARIFIPKMNLVNLVIEEKDSVIWEDGEFKDGISGIISGNEEKNYVMLYVIPGTYNFTTKSK